MSNFFFVQVVTADTSTWQSEATCVALRRKPHMFAQMQQLAESKSCCFDEGFESRSIFAFFLPRQGKGVAGSVSRPSRRLSPKVKKKKKNKKTQTQRNSDTLVTRCRRLRYIQMGRRPLPRSKSILSQVARFYSFFFLFFFDVF